MKNTTIEGENHSHVDDIESRLDKLLDINIDEKHNNSRWVNHQQSESVDNIESKLNKLLDIYIDEKHNSR